MEQTTDRPRRWAGRLLTAACLLAAFACAAGAVLGWAGGSAAPGESRLLARRVGVDGTTYLAVTQPGVLGFVRQLAAPTLYGPEVIDVSTPGLISVKGSYAFLMVWQPDPWRPSLHTTVWGWTRFNAQGTGVGPFLPGRSSFRVVFTRVALPAPFLATMVLPLATAPSLLTVIRRRRRARSGFAVLPVAVGGEGGGTGTARQQTIAAGHACHT